jgi:hypothetical protein
MFVELEDTHRKYENIKTNDICYMNGSLITIKSVSIRYIHFYKIKEGTFKEVSNSITFKCIGGGNFYRTFTREISQTKEKLLISNINHIYKIKAVENVIFNNNISMLKYISEKILFYETTDSYSWTNTKNSLFLHSIKDKDKIISQFIINNKNECLISICKFYKNSNDESGKKYYKDILIEEIDKVNSINKNIIREDTQKEIDEILKPVDNEALNIEFLTDDSEPDGIIYNYKDTDSDSDSDSDSDTDTDSDTDSTEKIELKKIDITDNDITATAKKLVILNDAYNECKNEYKNCKSLTNKKAMKKARNYLLNFVSSM